MAIWHFRMEVKSRGRGEAACAHAAYVSGLRIRDERYGMTHDYRAYRRLHPIEATGVALPEAAPVEWNDPERLWNAVEASERSRDAQLQRSLNVALPRELDEGQRRMLTERMAGVFTGQGMCVQWAIHRPDHGNDNWHAHFLLTMRPCDRNGFLPKSRVLYRVRRDGHDDEWMSGEELKRGDGWEKVYPFRNGRMLTMREAEAEGLTINDRKGKNPVSRKETFGGWDDDVTFEGWRKSWETEANRALKDAGSSERISRLSYKARGIDREPQKHRGPAVSAMERRGLRTSIGEWNRGVAERNARRAERERLGGELTDIEATRARLAEREKRDAGLRDNLAGLCRLADQRCDDINGWRDLMRGWQATVEVRDGRILVGDADVPDLEPVPLGTLCPDLMGLERSGVGELMEHDRLAHLKDDYLNYVSRVTETYRERMRGTPRSRLDDLPKIRLKRPPKEIADDPEVRRTILNSWRKGDEWRNRKATDLPKPSNTNRLHTEQTSEPRRVVDREPPRVRNRDAR